MRAHIKLTLAPTGSTGNSNHKSVSLTAARQLLGVEFIVMVEAWHAKNAQPPTLMGQVFTYNGSPNRNGLPPFYALHVWAWKNNPRGTFVDWNPQVSCEGFTGEQ